jgi:DnaJ-domain-containing protein 1
MEDAFGVFEDGPKEARSGTTHQHRSSVSPMIAKALAALDLETNATKEDIRGRYRELVRRFHPDTGGEDGDEKQLRRVMDAYRVLKSGGRC